MDSARPQTNSQDTFLVGDFYSMLDDKQYSSFAAKLSRCEQEDCGELNEESFDENWLRKDIERIRTVAFEDDEYEEKEE